MITKEEIIKSVTNVRADDCRALEARLERIRQHYDLFAGAKNVLTTRLADEDYGRLIPTETLFRYRLDNRDYGLGYVIGETRAENHMDWLVCMFCDRTAVYTDAVIAYQSASAGCLPYLGQYEIIGSVTDVSKALQALGIPDAPAGSGQTETFTVTREMWDAMAARLEELERKIENHDSHISRIGSRGIKLK